MTSHRLPSGGLIDRAASLEFRFDGSAYNGFAGDTLASALLASGVRLFGRSFKYHRPRGVFSAGPEEPSALVELGAGARREPNTPATTQELYAGLEAVSQNRFPSLRFDLLAASGRLGPLFAAGFYYKTFMWPARFWERVYEPLIRRAAGLGRAAVAPDPDIYEKSHLFCDVLVIGAGPAGLAAALAAARAGARVVLCERDWRLGGRILSECETIDDRPGPSWASTAAVELASFPEIRILSRTTVFGAYDHGAYAALERVSDHLASPPPDTPRQRLWSIVARRAVLAAGAVERALVFGGNDRPGVMLAGAVRTYLNRFAVVPGRNAIVLTAGDDGWRTVADCARLGINVSAIVDRRADLPPRHVELARRLDARLFPAGQVAGTQGALGLRAVAIRDAAGRLHRLPADLLAVAGGWNPAIFLASHLGDRPAWNDAAHAFTASALPPGLTLAGAAAGHPSLAAALATGAAAGAQAARDCGFSADPTPPRSAPADDSPPAPLWIPSLPLPPKSFVDLQHDVTASDIALAHREGFRAAEHLKRYTTLGMATEQGRTGATMGTALMAALTGRPLAEIGVPIARPPESPVAIAALAAEHRGRDFRPTRLPPAHLWAAERGARFAEAGAWLRAERFPLPNESDWQATVAREVTAVRTEAGVSDVSTLGKIELTGPDVGIFLDRLYVNRFSNLRPGRARYGLMLREDGFAFDDGTTARLGPERFLMTTTTAHAERVLAHMEFCHQILWPDLDLDFIAVTDRWAQFAIAGPRARAILERVLDAGQDISNEAFPFMQAAEMRALDGATARLFRISFSGELAYEIAVPARYAESCIARIVEAGATPYGTDALSALRIEKGHPAGAELNGQTTARDLGLARICSTSKDYIGRAMAGRPALLAPDRPALVGLRASQHLPAGAHLLPINAAPTATNDQGWVSSSCFSPTFGRWIGLGFLAGGTTRIGETLIAANPLQNESLEVEITAPCQYDPAGERLHA